MIDAEAPSLRAVADYQFGAGAGEALFPTDEALHIERSTSGRPRQVHVGSDRIVSLGLDGRFTLGTEGGRRLTDALEHPAYRVVVGDESEPFVRDGKNVFTKFVSDVDPTVRGGDEVVVVHERGEVIAVGRAELDAGAMVDFETGMAVRVRDAVAASGN